MFWHQMKLSIILVVAVLSCYSSNLFAIGDHHIVIIRHAEGKCDAEKIYHSDPKHANYQPSPLTEKGKKQLKALGETLLSYGFDNRHIAAVYVSPLPAAQATAQYLVNLGIVNADKVHEDKRLSDIKAGDREGTLYTQQRQETWIVGEHEAKAHQAESNEAARARMLKWHKATLKAPEGHILVITHGIPAMEYIEAKTQQRLKLDFGQAYLMPVDQA